MKQSVGRNTVYLISAFVGQKILSFIFFTLIARYLGATNTGAYVFALSYTSFFSIIIDMGLSPALIREVARNREAGPKQLNDILGAKILLALVTVSIVLLSLPFLGKPAWIQLMVMVACLIMVADSLALNFWAIFRGWQNLKFEAVGVVIAQLLIVSFGAVAIFNGWHPVSLIAAVLTGSLFQLTMSAFLVKRQFGISLRPSFSIENWRSLFKIAWPFGLAGIFTRFYSYLDQIMLSLLAGEKVLGWYSVPYKITFALQFIPQALGTALFPAMSDHYNNNRDKLGQLFQRAVYYLMILALPMSAGIYALAPEIIITVYGREYLPSILPLQIMMLALVFVFLNFPVGALLNGANRQTQQTLNLAITLVVNAVLNAILIPRLQEIGASIAIVISMATLFFSGLYWVNKTISFDKSFLVVSFFKAVAASVVMLGLITSLKGWLPVNFQLLVIPPLGAAIYSLALWLFGGISSTEVNFFRWIINTKIAPSEKIDVKI